MIKTRGLPQVRRSFFLAGSITLFWIVADLLLRFVVFKNVEQPFWSQLYTRSIIITFCGALYYVTAVRAARRLSLALMVAVTGVYAAMYTFELLTNLMTMQYFYTYLSQYHLQFVAQAPWYVVDAAMTYPKVGHVVLIVVLFAFFAAFGVLATRGKARPSWRQTLATLAVAGGVYALLFQQLTNDTRHFVLLPNVNTTLQTYRFAEKRWLDADKPVPLAVLHPAAKLPFGQPGAPLLPGLKTVVLVINESWGTDERAKMPLLAARVAGNPDYVPFKQAFTNATATDISWPAILTGVSPSEPLDRLLSFPIVSNLAAEAGFKPMVFCSWRMDWANIGTYLGSGQFTTIVDATKLGKPIVNDMGVDDMDMALAIRKQLLETVKPDDKILLVFGSNALHSPYQVNSPLLPKSDPSLEPYTAAAGVLDHALDVVLKTLEETGRADEALYVLTGDHGEGQHSPKPTQRVSNFYDYFAKVPLVVKVPHSLAGEARAGIKANAARNVQNLDIAPTLAAAFGYCHPGEFSLLCAAYRGASLFRPVAEDRLIFALSTNDVRQWVPEGFGIYSGNLRFIYSSDEPQLRAYDVSRDPLETRDVWESVPDSRRRAVLDLIGKERHLARIFKTYGGRAPGLAGL